MDGPEALWSVAASGQKRSVAVAGSRLRTTIASASSDGRCRLSAVRPVSDIFRYPPAASVDSTDTVRPPAGLPLLARRYGRVLCPYLPCARFDLRIRRDCSAPQRSILAARAERQAGLTSRTNVQPGCTLWLENQLRYSGPLSHRMARGFPRQPMICLSVRITRSDGNEKSTSMPSASRLKSSITLNTRISVRVRDRSGTRAYGSSRSIEHGADTGSTDQSPNCGGCQLGPLLSWP